MVFGEKHVELTRSVAVDCEDVARQLGQSSNRGINLMWHPYAAKRRVDFNVGKLAETSFSSTQFAFRMYA